MCVLDGFSIVSSQIESVFLVAITSTVGSGFLGSSFRFFAQLSTTFLSFTFDMY